MFIIFNDNLKYASHPVVSLWYNTCSRRAGKATELLMRELCERPMQLLIKVYRFIVLLCISFNENLEYASLAEMSLWYINCSRRRPGTSIELLIRELCERPM